MSDAPERLDSYLMTKTSLPVEQVVEVEAIVAQDFARAQARIAELEAALAEERNQVARYALRLVEIGEAILGPYDDAYRNSMVPEVDE